LIVWPYPAFWLTPCEAPTCEPEFVCSGVAAPPGSVGYDKN